MSSDFDGCCDQRLGNGCTCPCHDGPRPSQAPDQGPARDIGELRGHGGLVDRVRQRTASIGFDLASLRILVTDPDAVAALDRLEGHVNRIDEAMTAALSQGAAHEPEYEVFVAPDGINAVRRQGAAHEERGLDARLIDAMMQSGVWDRYLRGGHVMDARLNAGLLAGALAAALSGKPLTPRELAERHAAALTEYRARLSAPEAAPEDRPLKRPVDDTAYTGRARWRAASPTPTTEEPE